MTDHELLQQALNAIKHLCLHSAAIRGYDGEQVQTAIDALKARLAQPEPAECDGGQCGIGGYCKECPKPQQSWCMAMNKCKNKCEDCPDKPNNEFNPDWDAIAVMVEEQQRMAKRIEELTQLVTSQFIRLMDAETQLEKEWVGLTDDEYFYLQMKIKTPMVSVGDYINAMKMVEEKLKDKNGF